MSWSACAAASLGLEPLGSRPRVGQLAVASLELGQEPLDPLALVLVRRAEPGQTTLELGGARLGGRELPASLLELGQRVREPAAGVVGHAVDHRGGVAEKEILGSAS